MAFAFHQDSKHRRAAYGDFVDVTGQGSYVQVAEARPALIGRLLTSVALWTGPRPRQHGANALALSFV